MARGLKTAIVLAALCASFTAVTADAATEAAIRQQCRAMAERIWPPNTGNIPQFERQRDFLELGCLSDAGVPY